MGSPTHRVGYVAFLDVLGFSDLIARDDNLKHVKDYTEAIEKSVSAVGGADGIRLVLFSDSIILTTSSDEETALAALLAVCSRIFGRLITLEVPVRGAISYGQFIRSAPQTGTTIVAGRPINEAHDWEHRQDWVGIALAPSVLRRLPGLGRMCDATLNSASEASEFPQRLSWLPYLCRYDRIPFHRDPSGEPNDAIGFAVVPVSDEMQTVDTVVRGLERLQVHAERMAILGPDPKAQRKCLALRRFLDFAAGRWHNNVLQGASYSGDFAGLPLP